VIFPIKRGSGLCRTRAYFPLLRQFYLSVKRHKQKGGCFTASLPFFFCFVYPSEATLNYVVFDRYFFCRAFVYFRREVAHVSGGWLRLQYGTKRLKKGEFPGKKRCQEQLCPKN